MKLGWGAVCLGIACAAQAQVSVAPWQPAFQGIEQTQGTIDGKDASVFYAMRIHLKRKGVLLTTTPQEGKLDTISETTSQFLERFQLQAAINAGFFTPCCVAHPEEKHILGTSISEGKIVSHGEQADRYHYALLVTKKKAQICSLETNTSLKHVWLALSGSGIIVKDGTNTGDATPWNESDKPNPRTAVGLSQDGHTLYLLVIDGRKPGYSIGTTSRETAEILLQLGAYQGLNLDGGGSSTMVKADDTGKAVVLNRPSGGAERYDANQLGVRARPLKR